MRTRISAYLSAYWKKSLVDRKLWLSRECQTVALHAVAIPSQWAPTRTPARLSKLFIRETSSYQDPAHCRFFFTYSHFGVAVISRQLAFFVTGPFSATGTNLVRGGRSAFFVAFSLRCSTFRICECFFPKPRLLVRAWAKGPSEASQGLISQYFFFEMRLLKSRAGANYIDLRTVTPSFALKRHNTYFSVESITSPGC